MKKILSNVKNQEVDKFTIANEPISSIDLMERASEAFIEKFLALYPDSSKNILIFCGTGNNGGDGLAIARILTQKNHSVRVFTIGNYEKSSPDFKINLNRLPTEIINTHLQSLDDFPEIEPKTDFVIDGIFGSGLSRPAEGLYSDLISHVNESNSEIISIDIASGLFADKQTDGESIIKPNHTISFQTPKLAFLMPSLHRYVGKWHVVDIGLNQGFINNLLSNYELTESAQMKSLIPVRKKFDHKGNAGRLLIIAGSKGKMGAAILAAGAAFRTGAGMVYMHAPSCGLDILQTTIPEAMVETDKERDHISETKLPKGINAIAVGPGIGTNENTQKAVLQLIENTIIPLILDADVLNILAQNPDWLSKVPSNSILTPHPGEFKRLVGEWKNDFDRIERLSDFAKKYNVNIVLKGAYSAIADSEGKVHFNSTGNPGMATAGSGDVLTGIVGALLAQGLEASYALKLGVFLHGQAGDMAAIKNGQLSMVASDITKNLSKALLELENP